MIQTRTCKADDLPIAANAGDVTSLVGTWVNTQTDSKGLARAVIEQRSGRFWLRIHGVGNGTLHDWDEVEIKPHVAASFQTGFYAIYTFNDACIHLAANSKLGVLVILSMTTFNDDSGRPGYMERAFFCREHLAPRSLVPL